jgi:hypothetical protein
MRTNFLTDATKVLILVATVIVVCILCAIGFKMVNEGKSAVNASTNNLNSMTSQYQDIDVAIYDGATVQGSEVVNFIKKKMSANSYLSILVKTKANTAGLPYNYGYDSSATTGTLTTLSTQNEITENKASNNFINPSASFSGKTYKDANGIIICVEFTQQ